MTERDQMDRAHVFVVDGAPLFLDLMRDLLQEERYNVTTTNYLPRTFEQIAALRPTLLIADLEVGVRAGWDLLDRLGAEATTVGIPVVVVSTDPRLLARAEADWSGAGDRRFVVKPFDLEELLATVRALAGPA